jgi:hypothetical protein
LAEYRTRWSAGTGIEWTGPTEVLDYYQGSTVGTRTDLGLPAAAASEGTGATHVVYVRERNVYLDGVDTATVLITSRIDSVWSAPQEIAGPEAQGPRVVVGPDESVYVVWYDMAAVAVMGRRSTDSGATFGPDIVLAPMVVNLSPPPRYESQESHLTTQVCAGQLAPHFPSLAVDRSQGPRRGWMYAVWAEAVTGTPEPITSVVGEREPNNDPERSQELLYGQEVVGSSSGSHGGTDIDTYYFQGRAGDTILLSGETSSTWGQESELHLRGPEGRTLSDQLASGYFGGGQPCTNRPLLFTLPVDGDYFFTAPAGSNTRVTYRIRVQRMTPDAGSVARDHRDVVLVASADGGRTWSEKRLVNDGPPRFDDFLPEVAVDDLGRVHVIWYDRRDDVERGTDYHVYWTWSEDGGASFAPSLPLSSTQSRVGHDATWKKTLLGDRLGLCGTAEGIYGAWTFAADYSTGGSYNEHDIYVRSADVPPTAIVADLEAQPAIDRTNLTWRITDPNVLWKFDVERRVAGGEGEFSHVATVERATDIRTERYGYTDTTVEGGVDYEYRVVLHLANARTRPSDPVSTTVPPTPTTLAVRAAEALPDGTIRLQVTAPAKGTAELRLFDVQGSLVRSLPPAEVEPGDTLIEWDGRDDRGQRPGSGVYFLEVRLGEARATTKLVLSGG